MRSLVVIGACYMDTILSVPHYPIEDEKLRATSIIRRRGGNCPNTLEVLQGLLKAGEHQEPPSLVLCSVLPSRVAPGTKAIAASLGPAVDLNHCIYREAFSEPASSYIIKNMSSASRTIVNYNELPDMTFDEFKSIADSLEGQEGRMWFHFEGRIPQVTLQCIKYLRHTSQDVTISVEIEKPGRDGLQELAQEADVVFYARGWAQEKGYRDAEECLRAQAALIVRAGLLCCTWGESGSSALELPEARYIQSPAYYAGGEHVIDTIGAGDTFIAGMLYCLVCQMDWDVSQKLAFSNELAGRKVRQEGFSGVANEMKAFLRPFK